MSLNNIQLHPQLLVDLFGNVLVDLGSSPPRGVVYKCLGSNKKNILILVSKETLAFLEDEELRFLTNILAACNLTIADVALINDKNLPDPSTNYSPLVTFFSSKVILLFDVAPESIGLPFHFPDFQIQQFDGRTYMSAPSLTQIKENKALKTSLWNALKNMFGL
jgi:hypothetical protein